MVGTSRRRLLAIAGGIVTAGCSSDGGSETSATTTRTADSAAWDPTERLPDVVRRALGPAPESVDGRSVTQVGLFRAEGGGAAEELAGSVGLDVAQVDRVALVEYDGEDDATYIGIVGSFGAEDPVMLNIDYGTYTEPGRLIGMGIDSDEDAAEWSAGLDAATDTIQADELSPLLDAPFGRVFEVAQRERIATGYPEYTEANGADPPDDLDPANVTTAASGISRDETTADVSLAVLFENTSVAREDIAESILADSEFTPTEVETTLDGRLLTASGRATLPDDDSASESE